VPRIAIAFAAGACAALLGVRLIHGPTSEGAALTALVSDHARALVTLSTIEVSSRSTHTVKPRLNARLGNSPKVVDLAELGLPLMGGRRGFLGSEPIAVMVYAYGEHEIDLYALRAGATARLGERLPAQDGYNMRAWHEGGLRYVAVSDIAAARFDEFSRRAQERQCRPVE
jgi:anti-sigma factor RsiW